jgi:hypothetical protein
MGHLFLRHLFSLDSCLYRGPAQQGRAQNLAPPLLPSEAACGPPPRAKHFFHDAATRTEDPSVWRPLLTISELVSQGITDWELSFRNCWSLIFLINVCLLGMSFGHSYIGLNNRQGAVATSPDANVSGNPFCPLSTTYIYRKKGKKKNPKQRRQAAES